MKLTSDYVELIVDIAKQVETEDPIDWGLLNIDEDTAYRLITTNTLEHLLPKYDQPEFREIVIATVVKLVVENFVLNVQLQGKL